MKKSIVLIFALSLFLVNLVSAGIIEIESVYSNGDFSTWRNHTAIDDDCKGYIYDNGCNWWLSSTDIGFGLVGIDFGTAKEPENISVICSSASANEFCDMGTLTYSDDNETWTTITTYDNPVGTYHVNFTSIGVGSHRYWRVENVSRGADQFSMISEVIFYEDVPPDVLPPNVILVSNDTSPKRGFNISFDLNSSEKGTCLIFDNMSMSNTTSASCNITQTYIINVSGNSSVFFNAYAIDVEGNVNLSVNRTIEIRNTIPEVRNITFNSSADVASDLSFDWDFFDVDDDTQQEVFIRWINGTVVTNYENQTLVAGNTLIGDEWSAQITVKDDDINSSPVNSSKVVVGDTLEPSINLISLSATALSPSDTLTITVNTNDTSSSITKVIARINDSSTVSIEDLTATTGDLFTNAQTWGVGTYFIEYINSTDSSGNTQQNFTALSFTVAPSPSGSPTGGGGGTETVTAITCEGSGLNYSISNVAGRVEGYTLLFDRKTTKEKCRTILMKNFGSENTTIKLECRDTGVNQTQGFCQFVNFPETTFSLPPNELIDTEARFCIQPFSDDIEGDQFFFTTVVQDTPLEVCSGQLSNQVDISNFLGKFTSFRAIDFSSVSEDGIAINFPTVLVPLLASLFVWVVLIIVFSNIKIGFPSILIEILASITVFTLIIFFI